MTVQLLSITLSGDLGKPVYESHAIPDDDGYVEWYDVEFKHGIEKRSSWQKTWKFFKQKTTK